MRRSDIAVDDHVPDFSGHEEYERRLITETRWWSAAELRSTAEECFPATLADLLTGVLAKTPAADHLKR